MTATAITAAQIEALATESAEAGDLAMVAICKVALYGRDGIDRSLVAATDAEWSEAIALGRRGAREWCAEVIADAKAME